MANTRFRSPIWARREQTKTSAMSTNATTTTNETWEERQERLRAEKAAHEAATMERVRQLQEDLARAGPGQRRNVLAQIQTVKMAGRHVRKQYDAMLDARNPPVNIAFIFN